MTALATVWLLRSAEAQEQPPAPQKTERAATAVFLTLTPPSPQSPRRLDLLLRTEPALPQAPTLLYLSGRRAVPRPVPLSKDAQSGRWRASIEDVGALGAGLLRTEVAGAGQGVERHVTEFAIRGLEQGTWSALRSADGRFALALPPEGATREARYLVTSHEQPETPLPPGVTLAAGPFEVTDAGGGQSGVKAVVAIHLSPPAAPNDKVQYQIRRFDVAKKSWIVQPGGLDGSGRVAQAQVGELGVFVLTTEVK